MGERERAGGGDDILGGPLSVIMFQHQFAPKVRDGSKPHTIRPERKRPIRVGNRLSLRQWSEKAYRSPQIVLRETVCTGVESIHIRYTEMGRPIMLGGTVLSQEEAAALAIADGFNGIPSMLGWFTATHALPFHGVLISWRVA